MTGLRFQPAPAKSPVFPNLDAAGPVFRLTGPLAIDDIAHSPHWTSPHLTLQAFPKVEEFLGKPYRDAYGLPPDPASSRTR